MVLVMGDINLDIIINLREEINFNTDSHSDIHFQGGGSAANFSYWLDYLGQNVKLIAKTGDDFLVEYLKEEFQDTNIKFINLVSETEQTGSIVVLLNKAGDRTMITDRAANLKIQPNDIKEEFFENIEHFHLGGYSFFGGENMEKTALKSITMAQDMKIPVSFDPSSYAGLAEYGIQKILNQTEGIDFCFPNLEEGRVLTGKKQPEEITRYLMNYYKNVILKVGKEGCMLGNNQKIDFITQHKKLAEGDTTGAGDAFAAAFTASYLKEQDLKKAADFANQIGFACVNKIGGRPPQKEVN